MRILAIDDQPAILDDCIRMLPPGALPTLVPTSFDYLNDPAQVGVTAREAAKEGRPFVVALVAFRRKPGWDAMDAIRRLWSGDTRIEIILTIPPEHAADWRSDISPLLPHDRLAVLRQPFDFGEGGQLLRLLARKWQLARAEEEGFEQVFNASPLPQSIIALDTFEVIAVNQAYERMIGFTAAQLKGTTPESFGRGLNAQRWRGLLERLTRNEPVSEHAFMFEPVPGKRIDMRCSARALQVRGRNCSIWVIRDVTEQLRLEEQARQGQKMDALGHLASGIAHDFNNLLTAIQGFTSQAMADTSDPQIRELLEPVLATSRRAAALTRQLLIFGRQQKVEIGPLDLIEVMRSLKAVLSRLMSENILLEWELPESLPPILADSTNVEQIIVNLALNARDALPPQGGRIRIGALACEFATDREAGHADGRAGRFIAIRVSDNGSGIPPEVLTRIFEPFFTTKDEGKGTGLGLSTVYSLVRQHKGWIDLQTAQGKGTTFTVYQPVAEAGAVGAQTGSPVLVFGGSSAPTFGRVLAVDDDPSVQAVLRLLFDRYEIDSRIAPDGASAMKIWEESARPFDILITDMVMPNGYDGAMLARHLRARKPDLKVILMTGYSSEIAGTDGPNVPGPAPRILIKPFELNEVLAALTG